MKFIRSLIRLGRSEIRRFRRGDFWVSILIHTILIIILLILSVWSLLFLVKVAEAFPSIWTYVLLTFEVIREPAHRTILWIKMACLGQVWLCIDPVSIDIVLVSLLEIWIEVIFMLSLNANKVVVLIVDLLYLRNSFLLGLIGFLVLKIHMPDKSAIVKLWLLLFI